MLDTRKATRPFEARAVMDLVEKATGKPAAEQVEDCARLRAGAGQLTPQEYYDFRLYDDSRYTPADKAKFLGLAAQGRILRNCTDWSWKSVVHDKLIFQSVMRAYGMRMPHIIAVFHPHRFVPAATALRTADDVRGFLRSRASYPMFGKPVDGMYSLGSIRLDGYDAVDDTVRSASGELARVDTLVEELAPYATRGYLFQQVEHPDERVRAICGDRIATVRFVTLRGPDGPEIFRTLLKVPVKPNVADNFWRQGNMLAALDADTGEVVRAVTGTGPSQRELTRHPDTGAALAGFRIPWWSEARELCLVAARVISGLAMQAWDIAVCSEGPTIIEANVGGDFNLPQIATGNGLLDNRFARFLEDTRVLAPGRRSVGRSA